MQKESIPTKHGKIQLPAFMPDATYGAIKSISFQDAKNAGVKEIVTTTLHIEQKIGSLFIKKIGGIHKFFGWDRPILTDSGGWQVFSLINSNKGAIKGNSISELGCTFVDPDSGKHALLTAESSQQIQHNLGGDIVTVLDNPILGNASFEERKSSLAKNTKWAKRSLDKFKQLNDLDLNSPLPAIEMHKTESTSAQNRSLIGCVIQGGNDFELRKISAEALIDLDFDLYNFGGMPMHTEETWKTESKTGFYHEMLEYVSGLIPNNKYKYAMGVGKPDDIAFCVDVGWDLFDTVLPTRNARHGLLYVSEGQGEDTKGYKNLNYDVLHIKTEKYKYDTLPIDSNCNCEACKTISRSYLRHLIRINEPSGFRLATIHNLAFYAKWMDLIKTNLK